MEQSQCIKATLMAIQQGLITKMSDVCMEKCTEDMKDGYSSLVLRGPDDEALARISLATLAYSSAPSSLDTTEEQAIAWAYSMGYDIPEKMDGCSQGCLVSIALLIFVIPGIILVVWLMVKNNQYERDISALISKWIDAGRPEPGEDIFEESELVRIEDTTDSTPAFLSTEARLQELISIKEKGLISDSEYETLRKKALGL